MSVAANHSISETTGESLLERSLLFRRWQAMKQEILLHKWYESEKAGYDIGWERASTNWMIHHGGSIHRTKTTGTTPQA
jgi:hypothetical protein